MTPKFLFIKIYVCIKSKVSSFASSRTLDLNVLKTSFKFIT
jgi:hypothetical protein